LKRWNDSSSSEGAHHCVESDEKEIYVLLKEARKQVN
jgi:hypothetical protein